MNLFKVTVSRRSSLSLFFMVVASMIIYSTLAPADVDPKCAPFGEDTYKDKKLRFVELAMSQYLASTLIKNIDEVQDCWGLKALGITQDDFNVLKRVYEDEKLSGEISELNQRANYGSIDQELVIFKSNHPDLDFHSRVFRRWSARVHAQARAADRVFHNKEACPHLSIDLTRLGPIRDQGPIGWCFANAAADLASFYIGQPVSAADIAVQHFSELIKRGYYTGEQRSVSDLEGGLVPVALDTLGRLGFCSDEMFQSKNVSGIFRDGPLHTAKILDLYATQMIRDGQAEDSTKNALFEIMPGLKSHADVLAANFNTFTFSALANLSCGQRKKLPPGLHLEEKRNEGLWQKDKAVDFFNAIDVVLKRGEPVAFESDQHAAVIVGADFDPKSNNCVYKMRNSWGTGWANNGYRNETREAVLKNILKIDYFVQLDFGRRRP